MGGLIFLHPWLLAGLAALPALWYLLRVTPPPPRPIAFPAASFLAGLTGDETTAQRTPWWILLLRLLCLACVILGLAGPVLHPAAALPQSGPVRLVIDNGWAAAQNWDAVMDEANDLATRAARAGRPLYILTTAPEPGGGAATQHGPLSPADAAALLRTLTPNPWPVDNGVAANIVRTSGAANGAASFWLTSGLQEDGSRNLATSLQAQGSLTLYAPPPAALPLLLRPAADTANGLAALAESANGNFPSELRAQAYGPGGRALGEASPGKDGRIAFDLPASLRSQAQSIHFAGRPGAIMLLDDRFRRRAVGIAGDPRDDGAHYADAVFYLRAALAPVADITVAPVQDLMAKKPAVIILPDIGALPADDLNRLESWVRGGGLLLRFAGPAMTAQAPALTPTPLAAGDRATGGAMSWTKPQGLAPFPATSPLYDLPISPEIAVSRQLLAEPQPGLDKLTLASLADGTPLITARQLDRGLLVLVHTTATPQWSNFVLSGLFVQVVQRLIGLAGAPLTAPAKDGGTLQPRLVLDGFGRLQSPPAWVQPLDAKEGADATISARHPPGYYGDGGRQVALNTGTSLPRLAPLGDLPPNVDRHVYGENIRELDLTPRLLFAAFCLFLFDWLAMLALRFQFTRLAPVLLVTLLFLPGAARAAAGDAASAADLHLAYVATGDTARDGQSVAGLTALSAALNQRTSVDASAVVGVDPARDDLAFYPLLYWVVLPDAAPLPAATAQRVQFYLDHGGTILFDTGDQSAVAKNAALRILTSGLNIPPLVPLPPGHVLTKAFYLLRDFPARYDEGAVWVEEASAAGRDNVSSVIVADHGWAAAWAVPGDGGEMDRRFGVNLVLYALTGNYKNDQVHLAHILERLGHDGGTP